jgi:hypothetical protein
MTAEQIFDNQDKLNALDGATDMLEDLAAKCILNGIEKKEVLEALGRFYRQCLEVCESKYSKGLEIAWNILANRSKKDLTCPENGVSCQC